ncbi:Complex I intermediate-associated protein 84, mitochondrial [Wickerhamiella sorbophila]|uniref:Complex I intermediate-associated protein 84, mitochondrial n=1 Tax=Wickerhamiella sorbophila TaxID=45607 RepID=A0A2T0FNA2_9ASCO|nr:Complex I intermediate-associated protein 84, mitochondrial [Wickerhamiella sorbophila]PRT56471.1 Complex I intermediate-associated protein 84, mitochondrial [Wickerhamiella sorbophila]
MLVWRSRPICRALHIYAPQRAVLDKLFKKDGPKWNKGGSEVPVKVLQAAQTLRGSLVDKDEGTIKSNLLDLVEKSPTDMPAHLMRLIEQSFEKAGKSMTGAQQQQLFRSIVGTDQGGNVTTRIYMEIYQHSSLSPCDKLVNGRLFFRALRKKGLVDESRKLAAALLQNNASVDEALIKLLLEDIRDIEPDSMSVCTVLVSPKQLFDGALQEGLIVLAESDWPGRESAAEQIVNHALFENPHYKVSQESLVIILDTLMSFGLQHIGRRALQYALQRSPENLENLELLLLSCIYFEDSKQIGDALVSKIMQFSEQNLVKDTWDALAQWTVYCSGDLQLLKDLIEKYQASSYSPDSDTMHSVVLVASEHAKRSELDVSSIVGYFNNDMGIESDAATIAVLIKRALRSFEVEKARNLFANNQHADWNMDSSKYLPVLFELVIALCKSPFIDREVVFDVYQRVRVFSQQISYPAQVELLKMFFERNNQYDIGMFLAEQFGETPSLSAHEYKEIYHAFVDKILACTDYKEAWGLYGILNCTIALPYESYYPIQVKFCQLGRPDAAHLMFRHLRNRAKKEGIRPPGREMYLMLFAEYGRWLYEEGVKELETYFRMDLNNDLDIELMNTMLLAYANLQESPKVSDLWFETLSFPLGKGANNYSVTIMLKYLTQVSLEAVDDLWVEFPERFGITPDESNLRQYIVANCYHGYYTRAFEVLKAAPETYGISISESLIESLYNWTLIDTRKALIERWALETHKDKWLALKSQNKLKTLLLPENSNNDSAESLRAQAIQELEASSKLVKAAHRTYDED